MHNSTILRMSWFVENYVTGENKRVLDVGSMDASFSYRNLFKGKNIKYIGLDIAAGPNVDVVMDEPYVWDSLKDESFDYVISGQAFEHIEYPWLTIREIYKKMKPGGICCIIAPNTSGEHRVPKDCYRYFSDGLAALAKWAGLTVLDVTVSGIPKPNVSSEWDSYDNDVCLIAGKLINEKEKSVYPKLSYERRISGILDERLRYKFLLKWFGMENRQDILKKLIEKHNAKTVYIYGYGSIGRIVEKEISDMEEMTVEVIDQHVLRTENGCTCKKEGEFLEKQYSVMLLTVLDSNRDLKRYLDSIYPNIPKYYMDELFEAEYLRKYFMEHNQVYLYGAGDYGLRALRYLSKNNLKPDGFIVSDGRKKSETVEDLEVVELNEILKRDEQDKSSIGIIVAVGFAIEKEIENSLADNGLDYTTCDTAGVYSLPYGHKRD